MMCIKYLVLILEVVILEVVKKFCNYLNFDVKEFLINC